MLEQRRNCCLCEALCGVIVEYEDDGTIQRIRGNPDDPLSRGHVCPKAMALKDLHEDPDRLQSPVMKINGEWRPVPWDMAIRRAGEVLHVIQQHYGKSAVAFYSGNPNAHHYSNLIGSVFLRKTLGSRNQFSATSVDQLPHHFAALFMFGHQLLLPVPDLDRTDLLFIMGGNPMVSNGSIMTAPDFKHRARDIQKRDGRIVVIDPRRSETADMADEHLFIRPGTDSLFLMSMLQVVFSEGLVQTGRWTAFTRGLAELEAVTKEFAPERTETYTGIGADTIRRLARELAATPRAAFYGRIGVSTQEFGGVNAWLIYALNIVTGHFDTPGGVMFTSPAVDVVALSSKLGQSGSYNRWQSRVKGYPEFGGELPISTLVDEIETEGDGQVRAVITVAGNPVLSSPQGDRLGKALASAEFVVSLDPYINETTKHADIIIPSPSPLERDHFGLVFHALAVRNTVKYSPPLFTPAKHVHDEWETMLAIAKRIQTLRNGSPSAAKRTVFSTLEKKGPTALLDLLLRLGPHGSLMSVFGAKGLTLRQLIDKPNGIDLGPLESQCPDKLQTDDMMVNLAPEVLVADVARLAQHFFGSDENAPKSGAELLLIGRRQLRSNNSWLHNSERMMRGKPRCTLLIHPEDAEALGVTDGAAVSVTSRSGQVRITAEVSSEIMPGVVSIPHGWGHDVEGTELRVANQHPGVSLNDLVDANQLDTLTGVAALNNTPVRVEAAE